MAPPGFEPIYPVITFPARRGFWKSDILGQEFTVKTKETKNEGKTHTPKTTACHGFYTSGVLYFGRFCSGRFSDVFFFRAGFCEKGPFSRIRLGSNALVLRFYWGRIPQKMAHFTSNTRRTTDHRGGGEELSSVRARRPLKRRLRNFRFHVANSI